MSQAHHDPNDFSAQQQPTPSPDARTQRLVWQPRPKPKWPPDDFSQDAFEQRRRERLEEIRLVFARVAAGLPIKEDEDTGGRPGGTPGGHAEASAACIPGVSPGNRAESDPSALATNVGSSPALPGGTPGGHAGAQRARAPRQPERVPAGPTRYNAWSRRERPIRTWPEDTPGQRRTWPERKNEPKRPARPWIPPREAPKHFPPPYALWPSEPVYLPVPETLPPSEQLFKRPPPTLGKVAPLPQIDPRSATDGTWTRRFATLDTCTDLFTLLLVGINAVIELRKEHWIWLDWEDAMPLRAGHGLLQHPLPGLWASPLLPWKPEGTLTVLQTEVEQLVRVLEVPRVSEPESLREQTEALRQEAVKLRLKRLEEVVGRLRREMNKRSAARRVAELLARFAWRSLESLFLPEMPSRSF